MIFFLRMIVLISLSFPLYAEKETVVLMAKENNPALTNLYKRLYSLNANFNYVISTEEHPIDIKSNDFVVLVGVNKPSHSNVDSHKKTISVLITKDQSFGIKSQTSIWMEPPLSRQLMLANLVIPGQQKLGLLIKGSESRKNQLSGLSESQIQMLNIIDIEESENINQALFNVLKGSKLLLGSYDPEIYSSSNLKNILITSYRQKKVMIGPSRAYLKAGSLSTTFSDLGHVAQRIMDVVLEYQSSAKWLKAGYNPYYRILFNKQVARSLDIILPEEDVLLKNMPPQ